MYYDHFALRTGAPTEPCSSDAPSSTRAVPEAESDDEVPSQVLVVQRCRPGWWGSGLPDGLGGPLSLWGLPHLFRIPADTPPLDVHSAFGGLAIYRLAISDVGCAGTLATFGPEREAPSVRTALRALLHRVRSGRSVDASRAA